MLGMEIVLAIVGSRIRVAAIVQVATRTMLGRFLRKGFAVVQEELRPRKVIALEEKVGRNRSS